MRQRGLRITKSDLARYPHLARRLDIEAVKAAIANPTTPIPAKYEQAEKEAKEAPKGLRGLIVTTCNRIIQRCQDV